MSAEERLPTELDVYFSARVWVCDRMTGAIGYRWVSILRVPEPAGANERHTDEDCQPWDGDSTTDDCPF